MKFAFLIASIVAICYAQVPLSPNGDFRATIATATTTATASSGATTLTVASATGIKVYQAVSGTGIAAGTQVTAVSGTSITIFPGTTASLSAGSVTFGGLPVASSSKFLKVLAIDGLTACDTSTGGGTYQVILVSSGSAWTAPNCGGSGGGSAGANVSIAYAATISPTCASSSTGTLTTFIVGALTGNITVNNPSTCTPGQSIGFNLLQDGTGGRVVTWGTAYLYAPALPTAANSYAYYEFKYDGTSWNNTVARGFTCTPYTAGASIAMGSAGCPETANAKEASYPFQGTHGGTASIMTLTLNSTTTAFAYPTGPSPYPTVLQTVATVGNGSNTAPTLNVNSGSPLGAVTITKCQGSVLAANDIVNTKDLFFSVYYSSGTVIDLLNPATGCGGSGAGVSYPAAAALQLPSFQLALAKTRDGLQDTKIAFIGDSTTDGTGSTLGTTFPTLGSWVRRLNWSGTTPTAQSFGVPQNQGTDSRWTIGSGWALSAHGFVADYQATITSSFTATMTGGTPVTITPASSPTGTFKTTVVAASAATSNTVTITGSPAGSLVFTPGTTAGTFDTCDVYYLNGVSGFAFIVGIECYLSTTATVRLANIGQGGSTTTQWSTSGNFSSLQAISTYAPNLCLISLGINDAGASVATATVTANVQAIITTCKASGDAVLLSMPPSQSAPYATFEPLYQAAYSALATSNNIPFLDVYKLFGGAYNTPWMFDGLHPNEYGYWIWGSMVGTFLGGTLNRN